MTLFNESQCSDLEKQLSEAERRCILLEKQMEHMRKLVQSKNSLPATCTSQVPVVHLYTAIFIDPSS